MPTLQISEATADLPTLMREIAEEFCHILRAHPGCASLPAPNLPPHAANLVWQNRLFAAPSFRRAHVELFQVPGHFAVVHLCVHPHLHNPAPIYGFDMIAGPAIATGIFLDLSPVTQHSPSPSLGEIIPQPVRTWFSQHRPRPAWGDIFSDDFFAIRPCDATEIAHAQALARQALGLLLDRLADRVQSAAADQQSDAAVRSGQAAYACAQRQNVHTLRMLTRHVGAVAARHFIDTVLFPLPA